MKKMKKAEKLLIDQEQEVIAALQAALVLVKDLKKAEGGVYGRAGSVFADLITDLEIYIDALTGEYVGRWPRG